LSSRFITLRMGLFADTRYALRLIGRSPLVSAGLITSLAIGIAAIVAVFSVVNGVLLRALPIADPDRVFEVRKVVDSNPDRLLLGPEFVEARHNVKSCSHLAAYLPRSVVVTSGSVVDALSGAEVSGRFFETVGLLPLLGRSLAVEDEVPGSRVAVISERYWADRFQSLTSALGARVSIDGHPYTVVGVVPSLSPFPVPNTDIWLPIPLTPLGLKSDRIGSINRTGAPRLPVICRVASASSPLMAVNELSSLLSQLGVDRGSTSSVTLISVVDSVLGRIRPFLLLLQAAVAGLLVLICINVSSLLYARGLDREREVQVRTFLGATAGALARQTVVEGLTYAGLGGALGVLLSYWLVDALKLVAPADIPRMGEVVVDGPTLLFALGSVLVSGLAASSTPAWRVWRRAVRASRDTQVTGLSSARAAARVRRALVAGELAVAVILVVGAATLTLSFRQNSSTPLGFESSHLLTGRLRIPEDKYVRLQERIPLLHRVRDRLRSLPGVTHVTVSSDLPFASRSSLEVIVPRDQGRSSQKWIVKSRLVGTSYFDTLQTKILAGRPLDERERYPGEPAVVVNQRFAHQYLGPKTLGARISIDGLSWTVVGVAENVADGRPLVPEDPVIYRHMEALHHYDRRNPALRWLPHGYFGVKSSDSGSITAETLRELLAKIDSDLVFDEVEPMSARVGRSFARLTFGAAVLSMLAFVSVVVAALGVHGIVSHWLARRARELGIRTALGATAGTLLQMLAREVAFMVTLGLSLGLVGSVYLDHVLQAALVGTAEASSTSLMLTAALLGAVALLACTRPALRACRVDPVSALRHE
jgi:putative ABC transport system permease protein